MTIFRFYAWPLWSRDRIDLNATHTVRLEKQADGSLLVKLKHLNSREEAALTPEDALKRILAAR